MKTTIRQSERLQLIGLLTLSKYHNEQIRDLGRAARRLLELPEDSTHSDHVEDAVWNDYDADELLSKLEIPVTEPTEPVREEGQSHE
jgi:hypothetical protein